MAKDNMSNMSKISLIGLTATFTAGLLLPLSLIVPHQLGYDPGRRMPRDIKIEESYVPPSKIEVKLKDNNQNGFNETTIEVDGQNYLVKYNELGKPEFVPYTIVPQRISTER
jgi:hypothetical protein